MSAVAIEIQNLGKKYILSHQGKGRYQYVALRDVVANYFSNLGNRLVKGSGRPENSTREEFWALKDINFEIKQGERLGIIGRNGAGKTTLLKILSRITEPSTGKVKIKGRVSSLLEVGTGFHPELTGRENIFLNGAILGMTRAEIKKKFDEIVAFAEVDKFLDTPVKRYSSGMYVRLAFSVAAHLEPEILIVDEVLAVGDVQFQKKCLGKMQDVGKQGRTVLFVSHNMAAVKTLCEKALLLEEGKKILLDPVDKTVKYYLENGVNFSNARVWDDVQHAPGNEKARVRAVRILEAAGTPSVQIQIEDPFLIEVEYEVFEPETVLNISISLFNQDDLYILASPSSTDKNWFLRPHPIGHYCSRCFVPGRLLNQGRYSVSVLLVENGFNIIAQIDKIVSMDMVDVGDSRAGYFGYWGGVVRPTLEWNTKCLT